MSRQLSAGAGGRNIQIREILLRQGRCPKTVADGRSQGQLRREIIARGEFSVCSLSKVRVVLIPAGEVHLPVSQRVRGQIDIARIVAARIRARIDRRQSLKGLRTTIDIGLWLARADLVGFAAPFCPDGYVEWSGEAEVEGTHKIQVIGPLAVLERRDVKGGRSAAGIGEERWIT